MFLERQLNMMVEDMLGELYDYSRGRPFKIEWLVDIYQDEAFYKMKAIIHNMRMTGDTRYGYSIFDNGAMLMLVKEEDDG